MERNNESTSVLNEEDLANQFMWYKQYKIYIIIYIKYKNIYKYKGKTIFDSKMFQAVFSIEGETININTLYKMGLGPIEHLLYRGLRLSIIGLCKTEAEIANTNKIYSADLK